MLQMETRAQNEHCICFAGYLTFKKAVSLRPFSSCITRSFAVSPRKTMDKTRFQGSALPIKLLIFNDY